MDCIRPHPLPQNTHIQSLYSWHLNQNLICVRSPHKHNVWHVESSLNAATAIQHERCCDPCGSAEYWDPGGIRATPTVWPIWRRFLSSVERLMLQPLLSDSRLLPIRSSACWEHLLKRQLQWFQENVATLIILSLFGKTKWKQAHMSNKFKCVDMWIN